MEASMSYDWQSDAWRNGYDEWKTRLPDWWDAPDSDEDEPESYEYVHQRRHTLRQTADRSVDGNPAALMARELNRASRYPRRINAVQAEQQKRYMRQHIADARRLRTFIGPPCPDDMIPF